MPWALIVHRMGWAGSTGRAPRGAVALPCAGGSGKGNPQPKASREVWDWYLLTFRRLPQLVDELHHGNKDRQHQACCQHDENATNVLDAQGTGLLVLILRAAIPPPPLLLHDVQLVLLLQLQDGDGNLVPVR